MSYSQDVNTDEGTLRTLIYDTTSAASPVKGTDFYFDDAELTAILDLNSDNLWDAAADCCRSLAAYYARKPSSIRLDVISVDRGKSAGFYLDLAKTYMARSGSDVVEYMDSVNYDVDGSGIDRS